MREDLLAQSYRMVQVLHYTTSTNIARRRVFLCAFPSSTGTSKELSTASRETYRRFNISYHPHLFTGFGYSDQGRHRMKSCATTRALYCGLIDWQSSALLIIFAFLFEVEASHSTALSISSTSFTSLRRVLCTLGYLECG